MKRVITLFSIAFVLVLSGQAQSNRIGVSVKPQGMFVSKKNADTHGKGFAFSGGAYYEKSFGMACMSFGVGYTQFNHSFISIFAPADTTLTEEKVTTNKGFLSIPISFTYEYPVIDEFSIGIFGEVSINYLLREKQTFSGYTSFMKMSNLKFSNKLYYMGTVGINFTYLFTDELGISVIPTFSIFKNTGFKTPMYFGGGGCVKFFYMFGY